MKNLLLFLIRYSNFLLFILLEVVAFIAAARSNRQIEHSVWSAANGCIAGIEDISSTVSDYFHLREQNEVLSAENAQLRIQLMQQQMLLEPARENASKQIYPHLQWNYIPAKIIGGTTHKHHNYLVINKGKQDSIKENMGVISSKGVVGIVSAVGKQYSIVVPIIHTEINLSCRIASNHTLVATQWEGADYEHANLIDVSRHISLHVGDSIVTSGITNVFPEGMMVGIVTQSHLNEGANYYDAIIQLATDYRKVRYVQVMYNPALPQAKDSIILQMNGKD